MAGTTPLVGYMTDARDVFPFSIYHYVWWVEGGGFAPFIEDVDGGRGILDWYYSNG